MREAFKAPAHPVILDPRGSAMPKFTVNGEAREVNVPGSNPLLWVLRESLALTGTKFGCGIGQCGACTVLLNGQPIRSCSSRSAASRRGRHHNDRGPFSGWQITLYSKPGWRSRFRSAATANPGRSCRLSRCWRRTRGPRTRTSTPRCPATCAGAERTARSDERSIGRPISRRAIPRREISRCGQPRPTAATGEATDERATGRTDGSRERRGRAWHSRERDGRPARRP